MKGFCYGVAATVGAIYVACAVVMNFGFVNVAASVPHSAVITEFMHTTAHNAIGRAAVGIELPDFAAVERETGQRIYRTECGACHSGPGLAEPRFGKGLNPPAPELTRIDEHWGKAELFWIIKHGIRMTGMPAFGERLSDDEIWATVLILSEL